MKDDTDRLLDALEHPENYTDAEVEQILADPEARDAMNVSQRTIAGLRPVCFASKRCHSSSRSISGTDAEASAVLRIIS